MTMDGQVQQVFKSELTVEIGFSISTPDGKAWEKSNVSIKSHVGPGYPTKETMNAVLRRQMSDAVDACDRQIQELSRIVVENAKAVQNQ